MDIRLYKQMADEAIGAQVAKQQWTIVYEYFVRAVIFFRKLRVSLMHAYIVAVIWLTWLGKMDVKSGLPLGSPCTVLPGGHAKDGPCSSTIYSHTFFIFSNYTETVKLRIAKI